MSTSNQSDYLGVTEAAQYINCSRWLIWSRIKAGQLETRRDPRDHRRRLIRRADLERAFLIDWESEVAA